MGWFWQEKPKPVVIIRNVLGEEIDRVEGVRDLWGQDLRGRQWPHVDLSGMFLDGANLEGANLFGARIVNTSFAATATCATRKSHLLMPTVLTFGEADLDGAMLYRSETKHARFDGAIAGPTSDIPGKYVGSRRTL